MSFEKGTINAVRSVIPDNNGRLLILRRKQGLDRRDSGLWELPGGKLIPEDLSSREGLTRRDLDNGLRREVQEEVGLTTSQIGDYNVVIRRAFHNGTGNELYICFAALTKTQPGQIITDHTEHDDYTWLNPNRPINHRLTLETSMALAHYTHGQLPLIDQDFQARY